jgi:hypothetical protein
MKKSLIFIVCFLFIFSAAGYGAGIDNTNYYDLVKKLGNNDKNIDFKALRLSYTKTPDYKPYGENDSARDAALKALNKKDYAEAVRQAQAVLAGNYVDLDAHMICRIAYREMGNSAKYAFHNYVLKGLVSSLYASGDGTSVDKAIIVISTKEEYFILNANSLKLVRQSLISSNGRRYDKMEVENKKTGEKKVMYFDVDIPYGQLTNSLRKK